MKRFALSLFLLAIPILLSAQDYVTQFMGIPVDGSKYEVIEKLKQKGFVQSSSDKDVLEGAYSFVNMNVYIEEHNNKVYRIMLEEVSTGSALGAKIRYNRMYNRFEKRENYEVLTGESIPYDEDVNYMIIAKNKKYEAVFAQLPDMSEFVDMIFSVMSEKYSPEELQSGTEEINKAYEDVATNLAIKFTMNNWVWFTIKGETDNYRLCIYFDNNRNMPALMRLERLNSN